MKNIKNSKLYTLLIIFCINLTNTQLNANPTILEESFYINEIKTPSSLSIEEKMEFEDLNHQLTKDSNDEHLVYYHILKEVKYNESLIILEDGSSYEIGWWYSGRIENWKAGDRLKIYYNAGTIYPNYMEILNIDTPNTVWGGLNRLASPGKEEIITRIPNGSTDPDAYKKVALKSGWVFTHSQQLATYWNVKDKIYIFHSKKSDNSYDLLNLTAEELGFNWTLIKNEKPGGSEGSEVDDILNLESRLNQRVLAQPDASQALVASLLNYTVGLKDPKTPIGVFLFLGPTGVGKTEMAKVLTDEMYKTQEHLIRFDMSHFAEYHNVSRLIGSPPGYINHEEGGQLTEALKSKPNSVVLLDEIEKAHPSVRKVFLPVFDEGYITDSKDIKVQCNNALFIMTSNLCSQEISELFYMGYDTDEILQIIEPQLLEVLSPELYNRVEPIVFRPLGPETMDRLVDLMLADLVKMLKLTKNMELTIDASVKEYLSINGFHPTLGARPLKKLIQKKVSASLSLAIIKEQIPEGSSIELAYLPEDDSWHVNWKKAA